MTVADRLSHMMHERGMIPGDLALRAHLPPYEVQLILRGHTPIVPDLARRLAKVFGNECGEWLQWQAEDDA